MKLSKLLAISFFAFSIIASLIFANYSYNLTNKQLEADLNQQVNQVAKTQTQAIEVFLAEQEKIFYKTFDEQLFARLLTLSPDDEQYDQVLKLVHNKLDQSKAISAGVTRPPGIMVASKIRTMIGRDVSSSPGVQKALKGSKDLYSSTIPEDTSSSLLLGQGRSIFNKNGMVVGAAGMQLSMDELKEIVGPLDQLGKTAESYLINENSLMITPSRFLTGKNKGVLTQKVDTINSQNCSHAIEDHSDNIAFLDYRGEEVIGTHQHISKPNWCLLIEVNKSEILDTLLKQAIKGIIATILPLIFMFTLVGFFLGRYFDKKNDGRKISRYPCGIKRKFQPWYCQLIGGNCATYPNGRCGKVIKTRKFFINLKLRYYFLFALIFTMGCFFLITSFFQGWQNAAFHNEISDLFATFVLILFFFYGFKLKSQPAKKLIISGSVLSIISKLTQIILEEYILKFGVIPISYWIPGTIISFIGLFLIFFGFKEVAK